MAIVYLTLIIASRNTNSMFISNFLQNAEDMKSMRGELDKLRKEMDKTTDTD